MCARPTEWEVEMELCVWLSRPVSVGLLGRAIPSLGKVRLPFTVPEPKGLQNYFVDWGGRDSTSLRDVTGDGTLELCQIFNNAALGFRRVMSDPAPHPPPPSFSSSKAPVLGWFQICKPVNLTPQSDCEDFLQILKLSKMSRALI